MVLIVNTELPEENEFVMAVIKKILPYGAFCSLPEYNNLEAFLHVSEVAPRWIKNIHEFISEGQKHVVKVHHLDKEKNQVDISIKRVSDEERKLKLESVQNEKRGAKLLEVALKEASLKADPKYEVAISSEFGDVYGAFKEASANGIDALKDLDIPAKLKTAILDIAQKNIKKALVTVESQVTLTCFGSNGVEDVKKLLTLEGASVHYLGAPRYSISVTGTDYKSAEKKLAAILRSIRDNASNCEFTSDRQK